MNIQTYKTYTMKKTFILGAFATLMMVSCSKDYNCKCVTTESISGTNNSNTVVVNGKKDEAKSECEAMSSTNLTITKTCTIQ